MNKTLQLNREINYSLSRRYLKHRCVQNKNTSG